MTASERENPYGVRVPGSDRTMPGFVSPPLDDHPLVPWDDASHVGQWVDVDHARDQLDLFEECLRRLAHMVSPQVDRGHLVVVTGPVGMGKTTLIHRCIHRAQQVIENAAARAEPPARALRHVVAMTAGYVNDGRGICVDDNGDFASTAAINETIRDKIVAALRTGLPTADGVDPVLHGASTSKAFAAISALLAEENALLLAVVPHIEWKDPGVRSKFLMTCLSHAQSRILLFVEVSHGASETAGEVVRELAADRAFTHLALGPLQPDDAVTFGRSARSDHPDPDDPADDLTLREAVLRARAARWQPGDVRELRQIFHAAAEAHTRAGRPVRITGEDLAEQVRAHSRRTRSDLGRAP
ncbi:hypothetical protein OG233_10505 [Streptomyces sp. NBC_01218]|uniref:hypothetical protein n=1 Tax=unclassified Streptomyces TaxID=2593676 RepID=UPI0023B95236|nr:MULTISPECIES: hypothetical protein [unclassified Streptomyces]WEH39884.1 hypothetical protein PZB77_10335 [Streptomyces sp. AM 2-1-1]WSQ51575.1 hypothetical protein OG233_10505 [Streptomyces sp. NBC_01218]